MAWPARAVAALYEAPVRPAEAADRQRVEDARAALARSDELVGDVADRLGAVGTIPVPDETARASSTERDGLFLYRLVRALRPRTVVEFGSAVGISGAYIASALRANGSGRLVTVEGAETRQPIAARTIESVAPGVTRSVRALFDEVLDVLDGADLFFLDGNHHYEPTLRYVTEAVDRMARPAVLVLDDIAGHSERMDRAWSALAGDPRFTAVQQVDRTGLLALGEPVWHDLPAPSLRDRLRRR
jgi:predicted O-methyltransferase YrrM